MKSYLAVIKGSFQAGLAYRSGHIFTILNSLVYMSIAYYLWGSIYQGREMINGLTFNQTFLYITVAKSLMVLLKTWTDWIISNEITDGSIIMSLVKPINFQFFMLSQSIGFCLLNLMSITVPSILFLLFVFKIPIDPGIGFLFFPVALIFSFLLTSTIDYIIGLTSFFTESIWGISSTKDIIVAFFSGSLIPIYFFPEAAQKVLKFLPFQAMYNLPLMMLIEPNKRIADFLAMIGVQIFWVVVIFMFSRFFYNRAIKVLRVSGG